MLPKQRTKPHFLVIGAQKAGTTSLYRHLNEHPNVHFAAPRKEIHYFDLNFSRGENWYLCHFPTTQQLEMYRKRDGVAITGDSSPLYMFFPLTAARARAFVPDAKLIVLLRDPAERAVSHYYNSVRRGYEQLPLADALAAEEMRLSGERERIINDVNYRSAAYRHHSYFSRGLYFDQIQEWFREYPRDQFLFIRSEDLFGNPNEAFAKVCDFLGLPGITLQNCGAHNVGHYESVDIAVLQQLKERFAPANARLAALLGPKFDFNGG